MECPVFNEVFFCFVCFVVFSGGSERRAQLRTNKRRSERKEDEEEEKRAKKRKAKTNYRNDGREIEYSLSPITCRRERKARKAKGGQSRERKEKKRISSRSRVCLSVCLSVCMNRPFAACGWTDLFFFLSVSGTEPTSTLKPEII